MRLRFNDPRDFWIALCAAAFWLGVQISSLIYLLVMPLLSAVSRHSFLLTQLSSALVISALFALAAFYLIWRIGRARFDLPRALVLYSAVGFALASTAVNLLFHRLDDFLYTRQLIASYAGMSIFGSIIDPNEGSAAFIVLWMLASIPCGLLIGAGTGAAQAAALKKVAASPARWIIAAALAFAVDAALTSALSNALNAEMRASSSALFHLAAQFVLLLQPLLTGGLYGILTGPQLRARD